MDFFASQDLARRNTRKLVVLLIITIIALIIAVYGVVVLAFGLLQSRDFMQAAIDSRSTTTSFFFSANNGLLFAGVASLVIAVVSIGSAMKVAQLRQGGTSVANLIGGRRLMPGTQVLAERRILNVVEEMALASGVPVPPVYVLDQEDGINAFAAGQTIDDAVIGVNRGTIEKLNREELQGVIAHEFSHILNGDMRMSLRMIGWLHGIQAIALIGMYMFRIAGQMSGGRSSNNKGGNVAIVLLVLGGGLFAVGSIGLLFARIIKASISRQREYLADASAVQFTRIPDGIAGALKMIGADGRSSKVVAPDAESISHMFFANMQGSLTQNLLGTHPPLVPRIQRIEPRFGGQFAEYLKVRAKATLTQAEERSESNLERAKQGDFGRRFGTFSDELSKMENSMPMDSALLISGIGTPTDDDVVYSQMLLGNVPDKFLDDCRDLFVARCIVFASILDPRPAVRQLQLTELSKQEKSATVDETLRQVDVLAGIPPRFRLPIFEIMQGTLIGMSVPQFEHFQQSVKLLIMADQSVSIFEFFLLHHLLVHLRRHLGIGLPPKIHFETLAGIEVEAELLLSVVVRQGNEDETAMQAAFELAAQSAVSAGRALRFTGGQWDFHGLNGALHKLMQAAPQVKKELLTAIGVAIIHDQMITVAEAELFRAIAESLDCPVPPLSATNKAPR